MRKLYVSSFLITLFFLFSSVLPAKATVNFAFQAGTVQPGDLTNKSAMEKNISLLLTEIDNAGRQGRALNLNGISMEEGAKNKLMALWEDARFVCDENSVISNCLHDMQGFQVRNIPITMKPYDSTYDQPLAREFTISFNKKGVITGARLALELEQDVSKILNTMGGVQDVRERMEILKWVEDFRCYYNEKNLSALERIYSDDALIITGSVINTRSKNTDGNFIKSDIKYNKYSKGQYIQKLRGIFKNNRHINVKFDHISVMRHGTKTNIYGVTLRQKWVTDRYSDDGWLFLIWDFKNPEQPEIHVRTWQPQEAVAKDGVFTIDDFFIP